MAAICTPAGAGSSSKKKLSLDLGCLGCDAMGGSSGASSHVCGADAGEFGQSLAEVAWERSIWAAASSGDTAKLKGMLAKERSKVNAVDASGFTPLHYAARKNRVEIAKVLLASSADVNALGGAGKATALVRAAAAGHAAMVSLLIAAPDGGGGAAAASSAGAGAREGASGADPLLADGDRKTPLHKAAECGHAEVAALLHTAIRAAAAATAGAGGATLLQAAASAVDRRSVSNPQVFDRVQFSKCVLCSRGPPVWQHHLAVQHNIRTPLQWCFSCLVFFRRVSRYAFSYLC